MEIVKAFTTNDLHTNITIRGTYEEPLFRVIDIAEILQLKNIRSSIEEYEDKYEKVLIECETNGGTQKTAFFTETGLYKCIFSSRSKTDIAIKFKKWVCQVIKEIRINGKYETNKMLLEEKEKMEQDKKQLEEKIEQDKEYFEKEKQKLEEEKKILLDETSRLLKNEKVPVIYIYNLDTRNTIPELKIGFTVNIFNRIRPYKQTHKFGKIEFSIEIQNMDVKATEHFIHILLYKYKIADEVFKLPVNKAKLIINKIVNLLKLMNISDEYEMDRVLNQTTDYEYQLLNNEEALNLSTNTIGTQTELGTEQSVSSIVEQIIETVDEKKRELEQKFDDYIKKHCIIRPDVEVSSVDILGQYRIVNKCASKETYHALKDYFDRKFKPSRLRIQNKDQGVNGYQGIKLNDLEYKKRIFACDAQTFIFNACVFSPSGKTLISKLVDEYTKWKRSLNKEYTNIDILREELRTYLKDSDYVLYTTIWATGGGGQGYYGLTLKCDIDTHRMTSSTGKRVEKRDVRTNEILQTWETIAKAAIAENMCAAKMSRTIKDKTIFNDDYYYCTCLRMT